MVLPHVAKRGALLVFAYQSDQQGIELGDMWQHHPSHVVRRWFLDSAPFLPHLAPQEEEMGLSPAGHRAWRHVAAPSVTCCSPVVSGLSPISSSCGAR